MTNEMRKLMEAVQVNENDLYNFDKADYIKALGFVYADEIIAEYGADAINTDDLDDLATMTDAYLRDELDDIKFSVDSAIVERLKGTR